jgi:hypothetical protein
MSEETAIPRTLRRRRNGPPGLARVDIDHDPGR